jgi:hypothetical protein
MSENNKNKSEGYVIEGKMEVAVKGHLVLYSVVGGRINYGEYSQEAQRLSLGRAYVPSPRRPKDAFAISKDVLQNMSLPTLDEMEGWDSAVQRKVVVKPLKKGNEYAVQIELSGRSRQRRHKEVQNLFRISFVPPEDFNPTAWWESYSNSFWDEEIEEPGVTDLRSCVSMDTYWEDQEIDDPMLMVQLQTALLNEFVAVATSIDSTMLRSAVRSTLTSLGGIPFKSGAGSWFIPSYTEENPHLETLENYSDLLNYFGNRNTLNRTDHNTWYDETGKPRKWYRQKSNLRVMGYIDNERQLEYIRDDLQNALSLEVAEYQDKLLVLSKDFNSEKVDQFDERLNAMQSERIELLNRLDNMSTIVGGDISIPDTFSDVTEQFDTRLSSIGEDYDIVTSRLRGLMTLSQD